MSGPFSVAGSVRDPTGSVRDPTGSERGRGGAEKEVNIRFPNQGRNLPPSVTEGGKCFLDLEKQLARHFRRGFGSFETPTRDISHPSVRGPTGSVHPSMTERRELVTRFGRRRRSLGVWTSIAQAGGLDSVLRRPHRSRDRVGVFVSWSSGALVSS